MPTPTLPELRTNTDLTILLQRALRVAQELGGMSSAQAQQPGYMYLEEQMVRRIQEAQDLVEALGTTEPQAVKLVRSLLAEMQTVPLAEQRNWMSLTQAINGLGGS